MDGLAKHIRAELEHNDHCTVFRPEISRVWPKLTELVAERNAAIQAFAKERGWTAEIVDLGVAVTFRKALCEATQNASGSGVLAASGGRDGAGSDGTYRRDGSERR